MFEDIGHSSGAREKLRELYLGDLEVSLTIIFYCFPFSTLFFFFT